MQNNPCLILFSPSSVQLWPRYIMYFDSLILNDTSEAKILHVLHNRADILHICVLVCVFLLCCYKKCTVFQNIKVEKNPKKDKDV